MDSYCTVWAENPCISIPQPFPIHWQPSQTPNPTPKFQSQFSENRRVRKSCNSQAFIHFCSESYIYEKNNELNYRCHNCGISTTLGNFIREIDQILYKQYIFLSVIFSHPHSHRQLKIKRINSQVCKST